METNYKNVVMVIVAVVVITIIGYLAWKYKPTAAPTKSVGVELFEKINNPVKGQLPETNPFKVEANPFKTNPNPFSDPYKNPF